MDGTNRDLVMEFLEASARADMEVQIALLHEDMVMEWPQSGKRFTGRANAASAMRAQEDKPEPAGEPRMVGVGRRMGRDDAAFVR